VVDIVDFVVMVSCLGLRHERAEKQHRAAEVSSQRRSASRREMNWPTRATRDRPGVYARTHEREKVPASTTSLIGHRA
jgi:hypothetical protein